MLALYFYLFSLLYMTLETILGFGACCPQGHCLVFPYALFPGKEGMCLPLVCWNWVGMEVNRDIPKTWPAAEDRAQRLCEPPPDSELLESRQGVLFTSVSPASLAGPGTLSVCTKCLWSLKLSLVPGSQQDSHSC